MKNQINMIVCNKAVDVKIPNGFSPAHGPGLDGKTMVRSLRVGESPDYAGKHFVKDVDGNAIMCTADELFVAARLVARKEHYKIKASHI